ncbi:unnamed protein product [Chrysodeixis includens]|uniref:Uncharacterized protein n=1 Tax=Chrysodeixis includens TaxID=689277 RepID=A0A9N8KV82_CHRIL|nr:unnamed protein product [Chrysodeixis includens]
MAAMTVVRMGCVRYLSHYVKSIVYKTNKGSLTDEVIATKRFADNRRRTVASQSWHGHTAWPAGAGARGADLAARARGADSGWCLAAHLLEGERRVRRARGREEDSRAVRAARHSLLEAARDWSPSRHLGPAGWPGLAAHTLQE